MPVDFSILQRAPTIGQGILAGQQRGRERELQNRLLARQDLQFQQQQEDRARQLQQTQQQEAIFKQASDMIRQAGLDPDDPQVLQQFTAAAVQSRQPQLISLANTMSERAAKRAEERRRRDLAAKIMAGDEGGSQRGDAAALAAPVAAAAPAVMTQPPAAPAIAATTFDEGAARQEMPRPSVAARTAGVEPPMPMGPVRELPLPNALAPAAPAPVNTLVAAPSAAQPAKPTTAPKVDVAALEANLEQLEQRHTQLLSAGLDKEATVFYNSKIKPLERRIEKLKPKEYAPTELERLNALVANLPPGSPERKVYEARIAKLTAESKGITVKLPEQQGAFEKELGEGQAKKVLKDRDAAEEAVSIIDTVRRGRELLSGPIITGFGAEFLTNFGSALNQIGFSVAKDAVANTQAFAANMAQNVGKIIKQFGAGTGLSNADREYAEKMAGGKITLDKEALEKILEINERGARNVIQSHNKRVANIKTNIPLTVEMPAAPTARGRVGGEATSVKLPDGRVMNFPDAAAATAFKKAAGL